MVALLAEGVDRNSTLVANAPICRVALLAEGVDRNTAGALRGIIDPSRPPRGGRG